MQNTKCNFISKIKKFSKFISIIFFFLCFLSFFFPSTHVESSNDNLFYVSTTGNDNNPGTIDAPWLTLQKAADSLIPGQTVYVREGIYSEFVKLRKSGTKDGGYITFKAYPGEHPVLDAQNQPSKKGNSAFFEIEKAHYIVIDGFEMRNLTTRDSQEYPVGILARNDSSNIRLLNNKIHHISNYAIGGNAHGILFYGDSSDAMQDIAIENNEIYHLTLGNSEALTLSGNINGFRIFQNKIHHNDNIGIDAAGFYKACENNCVDQVRNGKISSNIVYNNSSGSNPAYNGSHAADGIYADGSTNIKIENNIVYKNDFGIELASENYGKTTSYVTVQKNKVFCNNGPGLIIGGASSSNGGAYKNSIRDNEFFLNNQLKEGFGEITIQHNSSKNQILDNKFYINKTTKTIQKVNKSNSDIVQNNQAYFRINIFCGCNLLCF